MAHARSGIALPARFRKNSGMLKKLKWILILAVVLGGGLTFMLVKTTAPFGLRYKEVPTAAGNATGRPRP